MPAWHEDGINPILPTNVTDENAGVSELLKLKAQLVDLVAVHAFLALEFVDLSPEVLHIIIHAEDEILSTLKLVHCGQKRDLKILQLRHRLMHVALRLVPELLGHLDVSLLTEAHQVVSYDAVVQFGTRLLCVLNQVVRPAGDLGGQTKSRHDERDVQ